MAAALPSKAYTDTPESFHWYRLVCRGDGIGGNSMFCRYPVPYGNPRNTLARLIPLQKTDLHRRLKTPETWLHMFIGQTENHQGAASVERVAQVRIGSCSRLSRGENAFCITRENTEGQTPPGKDAIDVSK